MTEDVSNTALIETTKILLIDLENYPSQINELQKVLNEYSLVVICYAHSNAKIPLDWLMPLNDTINADKLKVLKMTTTGKNAADFGISFYAGMLMQQMPTNAHFAIMSDDADLDHVVNLLRSQNRTAERVGMKKEEPKLTKNQITTISASDVASIKLYCSHLVTYKSNRPAKKETLVNSIKNKFKDTPDVATNLLYTLVKHGALSFQENKVLYNDKKIVELSRQ